MRTSKNDREHESRAQHSLHFVVGLLLLTTFACSDDTAQHGQDATVRDAAIGDRRMVDAFGADSTNADSRADATNSDIARNDNGTLDAASPDSGSQVAPLFFDDFETGDLSHAAGGFHWTSSSANASSGKPSVANDLAHSGSHALRFEFGPNTAGQDAFSEQRFAIGNNIKECWVELYIYYPNGSEGVGSAAYAHRDDTGPDNNKFFRIWGDDYGNSGTKMGASTRPGSGTTISRLGPEYSDNGGGIGHNGLSFVDDFVTTARLGQWLRVRQHYRLPDDDSAANGVIQIWVGDTLEVDESGLDTQAGSSPYYWNAGYLLGWANSGFTAKTYLWIDDVAFYDRDPGW
jgi:hypothetical protein